MIDHRDTFLLTPDMRLRLGKIEARVRFACERGLEHGLVRPELWVGEQRIPASPDGTEQQKAPPGTSCELHGRQADPYRSSGREHPAKYTCAGCRRSICARCTAIDRVLCRSCFGAALSEEQWLRDAYHRRRHIGFGIVGLGIGALVLFATLSWRLWAAAAFGGLLSAGSAGLIAYTLKARGRRPVGVWSSELVIRRLDAAALGDSVGEH